MLTRRLGRTGHQSSVAILGAAAFWDSTVEATRSAFASALAAGVNHVDIAPAYGAAERTRERQAGTSVSSANTSQRSSTSERSADPARSSVSYPATRS